MTTEDNGASDAGDRLAKLNDNLAKLEELNKRLMVALAARKQVDTALHGPAPDVYMKAAAAYFAEMMQNPAKILEHQINYWGKSLKHYVEAQQTLAKGELKAPPDPTPKDRRFANPLWETHPFFNYLKQQYLMNAEAVSAAVGDMESLDPADKRRVEYFTKQIVDMFSPTNFLGTNPEALEKAVETVASLCGGWRTSCGISSPFRRPAGDAGGQGSLPCRQEPCDAPARWSIATGCSN